MDQRISVALNLRPSGEIVMEGDHSPGTSSGIPFELAYVSSARVSAGVYRLDGSGISLPEGWRASVFRDENDEPTIRLSIIEGDGFVEYRCSDPESGTPKDIVYLLTLRVMVVVTLPEMVPANVDETASAPLS